MADRYWVGGTGNWDATTTNWSATSGGAGGASVPTLNDDVFFDALSNLTSYTVTLTSLSVCRSVSVAGPATGNVTITGLLASAFAVYGSFTLAATGVTWTFAGTTTFLATTTGWNVTTNGVSLTGGVTFNNVSGGWTLGSAFTSTSGINFTAGTFSTANFNITLTTNFTLTGSLVRTINLGSSAVAVSTWNALGATNLTVNAGTSTITIGAATFNGGGLTYYNVIRNNNGFAIGEGGNTFNALTNNGVSTSGSYNCTFAGNQTIGTLTVNGGASQNFRAIIQTPNTLAGTQITLTVASFVTNGNVDFRDINFQGAASPLTIATGGNGGNNTNITLAAPKTVYWNLAAGGAWNAATAWATTSGGAPSLTNFPLIQDTAIIDDAGLTSGNTISLANNVGLGTVNMSSRTLPMTFTVGTGGSNVYGDLTLSSSVTCAASTGLLVFTGYNKTQTITSASVTFESGLQVNNLSTTVTLNGALTLGTTRTFTLTLGTLNLNGQTLTTGLFSSTGAGVRNITFGGGTITTTGATYTVSGSNFTTSGSGTISMTSASSKTFAGGGFSYPTLNQGGAGALVITGANTFANITDTVQPATITFPASTITTVANFSVSGTAGNLITLNSSTSGTRATLAKPFGTVNVSFTSIKDLVGGGGAEWNAYLTNGNVDAGNNSGWNFVAVPFETTQDFNFELRSFTEYRRF
jgi:hypothetical protein